MVENREDVLTTQLYELNSEFKMNTLFIHIGMFYYSAVSEDVAVISCFFKINQLASKTYHAAKTSGNPNKSKRTLKL